MEGEAKGLQGHVCSNSAWPEVCMSMDLLTPMPSAKARQGAIFLLEHMCRLQACHLCEWLAGTSCPWRTAPQEHILQAA